MSEYEIFILFIIFSSFFWPITAAFFLGAGGEYLSS